MPETSDTASTDRDLDLILFGATGFTGGLTAEYLAEHGPAGLRWALAGRSLDKLEKVRARLDTIKPGSMDLELIVVDAADEAALASTVARTKVVATTVGPYLQLGGPLVGACAAAGTDYVDLTGEPEFVDRTWLEHHETAVASGARIVHACGFDSIPHDLGAYYTVLQLKAAGPVTMRGVVRGDGTFSGGTFHSAMGAFSRAKEMAATAKKRRTAEARPEGRSSRAVSGKPGKDPVLGYYLLPLPTIDPQVVARSGAALTSYGPEFRYSHFAGTKTLRYAVGGAVGVSLIGLAAQVKPARNFLLGKVKQGEGPDEAKRARSSFSVDFVAEGDGRTLHTRVSGGDPGYGETAKMLSEAALSLAFDDNPTTAGSVTTAQAMGDNLLGRLRAAGIVFEVVG
ncbi:MAG: saccharopine dehydrogenase NADP-binding domain-containing protein [Nocardioides sp.]|uniref:saccharopine dehydrogenase family protein n=1 Tax=Nocardioides sp. TaxID=35761 RepID=UPI002387CD52|nr:saccharopine dehydrogenase NADP-binding domain-containing protein [Nocardioides sp.]MDE0775942.1 saccharopine dehydrogenase NADP-binding domain-containing protein [Nocardioides sp.]